MPSGFFAISSGERGGITTIDSTPLQRLVSLAAPFSNERSIQRIWNELSEARTTL